MALSNATLSSLYSRWYPASNAIDGDLSTLAASSYQANAWLSVRVPTGSSIGLVAVHNRNDGSVYQNLLGSFEIWLGASAGARMRHCGSWTGPTNSVGPFVVSCSGASSGDWVTLRQLSAAGFLTVVEICVYPF